MSDMNLPTVEIDPRTADFIGRHDTGRINLAFDMEDWSPNPGKHALVPVDAMEKVWWCGHFERIETSGGCYASRRPDPERYGCGWRFLVSAKEEE